ncbi:Asp-tRNA(Asn)/Glu-tRNA(Gln) amidotransferase subunit GatC [Methanoplanus sp. FWC-SCC4]|uniref:Aspartyl/glutamyl-tRNA(Asn/Gln) amidotransferase subunit C n=1 Tax=Methanochimaera problematica TaxID=2609417 RepID=A0AA97I3A6_9EURY|nr:Asp-tRNA(Asn)/Glu-tRNA(Gln) amidotransferase subunit GatC [Methanoplanus sp. FWC-SCC4]WOF15686.1 Asp-tRNA(Asn)/Glu-tRNA(Gln) amidotransferase subunit GatC [Methanoplanus sp. FWC-SCC4]
MVSENEVEGIARLADITIEKDKIAGFTDQFNNILEYFDILDTVDSEEIEEGDLYNVLREDEIIPSLPQEEALSTPGETEEGYIKAPKVM